MNVTTQTVYDAAQKTWRGPKREDFYGSQSNLGGEIIKSLKENPTKVVQLMDPDDIETTAAQILCDSEAIANEFMKTGLEPGDVIGIYASNTKNLAAVIVGAMLCGCPWNPIYAEFDKDAIKQAFEITTPKIICCDVQNYAVLMSALEEMTLQVIVYTINGKISNVVSVEEILNGSSGKSTEKRFPGLHIHADETAAILCSSGTTGHPKGVLVSHRSLLNNIVLRDLNPESVIFCFSPLFWISGVWALVASLVNGVKRIITSSPSTPENLLNLIQKYSITHVLISTTLMTQLVQESKTMKEKRLNVVHCLCTGGAKVSAAIGKRLYELFDFTETKPSPIICYGMTELGGMLTETHTNTAQRRYDTEGKLMPNMEARIVDRETGTLLGPNETGFILVRLPFKWAGYYRNTEATRNVYQNGWLNTGDVGYFDDEGYLYVCARESDIFKSYGFQVYPDHLENLILQIPGVSEVCIFGVPDLLATNLITCAIVRSKDAAGAALTAAQVESYVKQHVAKTFQLTGGVYFLENLPRNPNGKLLRRKVFDSIQNAKT